MMRVEQIDPADTEAIASFYRIYLEVGRVDDGAAFAAAPIEQVSRLLQRSTGRFSFTAFLGFVGIEPVASGWCGADIKNDPRLINLLPRVLPQHRRLGHGTRMLQALERHASDLGRTLLQSNGVWAPSHGAAGTSAAPVNFATKHGWQLGLANVRLRLALPTDQNRLDRLLAIRDERRRDYRVRTWNGPVPEDLLEGWAALHSSLSEDAPHGALDQHTQRAAPAVIREDERVLREAGLVKYNSAALSPAGEPVAYSSILRSSTNSPALQQGTVVLADHRGRGLGALVKIAAIRLLERAEPTVPAVITENAQENEHMLSLNRALGCVPVAYSGVFQKRSKPTAGARLTHQSHA